MRKIVIGMYAGQAGTDSWLFFKVPVTLTEQELNNLAWQCAKEHAEMYGIYPADDYSEEEIDEDPDSYSDSIEGWYEDYDPEEHDGHRVGDDNSWSTY